MSIVIIKRISQTAHQDQKAGAQARSLAIGKTAREGPVPGRTAREGPAPEKAVIGAPVTGIRASRSQGPAAVPASQPPRQNRVVQTATRLFLPPEDAGKKQNNRSGPNIICITCCPDRGNVVSIVWFSFHNYALILSVHVHLARVVLLRGHGKKCLNAVARTLCNLQTVAQQVQRVNTCETLLFRNLKDKYGKKGNLHEKLTADIDPNPPDHVPRKRASCRCNNPCNQTQPSACCVL